MFLEKIKSRLRKGLNRKQILGLHRFISRNKIIGTLIGVIYGNNLSKLAVIYNTDKYGVHFYTPHYQNYFKKLKYNNIKLLEIGIGGYSSPDQGGNSLRMWKRYFPFGKIFAIDIFDKRPHNERRIKTFKGSQIDIDFLNKVCHETGKLDIIIDDGSHINEHVINTFKYLFPKLKCGGLYVVEDTQTSYWKKKGGDSKDLNNPNTMMNFFKRLTDGLNYMEFEIGDYRPQYFDMNITSIHFYHNLIFIIKGNNDEKSNAVKIHRE